MRAALLALLAVCVGLAHSQTSIIRNNHTSGACSASNSNCDWLVGFWNVNYQSNSYSCTGSSPLTQPATPDDVCCTNAYTIPAYCVAGYREDDGLLVTSCIYQEARFYNKSSGVTNERTITSTVSIYVNTLNSGLNYSWTSSGPSFCTPFRQLTTDSIVSNSYFLSVLANGQPSCPEFPQGTLICDQTGVLSSFQTFRRRIPASRNNGYNIYKYFNSHGNCSISNENCDWLVGSWDGIISSQGYSYDFTQGLNPSIFPSSPTDVRCASEPFFVPYTCDFGYSTFTGDLLAYCVWGPSRVTIGDSFFFSTSYDQFAVIPSLHNGIQLFDSDVPCLPMDRIDTDTIIFNVAPIFPDIDCTTSNTSPDTNVQCSELGVDSINVAFGVLVRGYGDDTTTGTPGGVGYSSASTMTASFLMTLFCALYLLF